MRRGNGGIRREQSGPTLPGFQQRRPQIERGVSKSAAVFSFRKEAHLRRDSGCAQGSVKRYAGIYRRQFIFIPFLFLRRLADKVRRIINAPAALVLGDTWVWAKWPRPGQVGPSNVVFVLGSDDGVGRDAPFHPVLH
jgi:hypothetical protein